MKRITQFAIIALGALLVAFAFNLFLVPNKLLSGGVSGISMMIGYFTSWHISLLYFLINLPILIWGYKIIGRNFIVLSIVSVVLTTWFMALIPIYTVTDDRTLSAVFGGVLVGIGAGVSFRAGGSTGGFDIVGSILTRKRDFPLGYLLFGLNALVIIALGYIENWDLALNSMLSIFVAGKLIDFIHVSDVKVTVFIITENKDKLLEKLLRIPRGVTALKSEGAYSHKESDMLMTVTTRYELAELQKIIRETDPKAFVNIVETVGIMGQFRK